MKSLKKAYIVLAAGIFILSFSTILGSSISAQYAKIHGPDSTNKVAARVIDNTAKHKNSAFTLEELKHLQEFTLKGQELAFASEDRAQITYKSSQSTANVFGVSDGYDMFHQLDLESGSFMTEGNSKTLVAVIDENLAAALFNNTNVVGMYLELYNQRFKIIGVIDSDESFDQALTDSGYGSAYIPVELMLRFAADSKITSLEVRTDQSGITGKNMQLMQEALASIGKNASDYKIIDYTVEKFLLEEKTLICVLLPGVCAIFLLLGIVKKRIEGIYTITAEALKENYLKNALKSKYHALGISIVEIAAALTLIFIIWNAVSFSLYIPAKYVPDELIDTAFFSKLFESLINNKVQSIGYVPAFTELKANILNVVQWWNLIIDLFIGLPMYAIGVKLLAIQEKYPVKRLLYGCSFLMFSIVLSLYILNLLNLPLVVNTKGMLIVLVLVFLSVSGYEYKILRSDLNVK